MRQLYWENYRLLVLDEPITGMNEEEKEDKVRFILDVHELKEISVILVEHGRGVVMGIVDGVVVLDCGKKVAEGLLKHQRMGKPIL